MRGPGGILLGWSPLGLKLDGNLDLSRDFMLLDAVISEFDETYELVTGKTRKARNHFRELRVRLSTTAPSSSRLDLLFRAYDDGAAVRYIVPAQENFSRFGVIREETMFCFPSDLRAWAFQVNMFRSSFEGLYSPTMLDSIPDSALVHPPLTLQRADGMTISITEGDLSDYAGMYLSGTAGPALRVTLPPLPGAKDLCVRGTTPFSSPWRVLLIGNSPGTLIESTLIENLTPACTLEDASWIAPGKAMFPWWPAFFSDRPGVPSALTFENQKYYIDFASENNIGYLELEPPWYGDESDCIANPQKYDITKPVPELRLPELLDYARSKGVRLFFWAHWENVDRQADEAFPLYEKWGAAGVKIDFMNRDDQEMVRWIHTTLKKAAAHRLMVYFHGSYKPTGERRTYPNLLTVEGVLGNEQNKVQYFCTPEHTVTLPFTRMLAGPMDFTPGGFRNVTATEFTPVYDRPRVMGTRCHQLAMYVVYESPLVMVCDDPAAYRGQPGLAFLRDVPTSWDETRVIAGEIGDYIAVARRRGTTWYLGAMTDWTPRDLQLSLGFLSGGDYLAESYLDGPNAERSPTDVRITRGVVRPGSRLTLKLASGGGAAIRFLRR